MPLVLVLVSKLPLGECPFESPTSCDEFQNVGSNQYVSVPEFVPEKRRGHLELNLNPQCPKYSSCSSEHRRQGGKLEK